jgi:NitT/TauT family transport system substrate-binding protein
VKRSDILALASGALGAGLPIRSYAADTAPVRIALVASDSAGLCDYGKAAGLLAKAGIAVSEQYLSNGAASMAALLGGSVDVTPVNSLTALQASEKGLPVTIIAMEAIYRTGHASTLLLVRSTAGIRSAADLSGKTVAVSSLQSNPHVAVMMWIDKNGGDSKAVKYTELSFAAMPAALEANRVDAAMMAEPGLTESLGFARVLGDAYGSYGPTFLMDCFVSTKAWTDTHPEETRNISKVMLASALWANRHHDETGRILATRLNVEPHVVATMRRAIFGEVIEPALLEPVLRAGLAYGALTNSVLAASVFSPYVL